MMTDKVPDLRPVATLIAKGDPPPQWLVDGLEFFITNPDPGPANAIEVIERMQKATDLLLRYLPGFDQLPRGWHVLDVPEAVEVLSQIKFALTLNRPKAKPKTGRPPNIWRQNCAAVVLEAWKQCHGKAEPHSQKLRDACEEYWKAWGGKPLGKTGTPENWRKIIEKAAAMKWPDIEPVFVVFQQMQQELVG
jgi:hypothetical protein